MEKYANRFVLVWALALTAFLAMGLTIPNTFVSGTTISAAQMNANFAAIDAAVDALENPLRRGTVLLAGRVTGEAATPGWAAGAYTSTGALPVINDDGTGSYRIALPGGESFDRARHMVVVTPIEFLSPRIITIENGSGGTIDVNVFDETGAFVDEDFQIIVFND